MNKITPDHLTRSAYVYVRQSTPDQLANNPESRRRQYALADRARVLGWKNVIVIDDDLGRSGGGTARPGFERLLAAICTGAAGAVLGDLHTSVAIGYVRGGDRGFAPRPQWPGLAHASGVLHFGEQPDHRRGRRVRSEAHQ